MWIINLLEPIYEPGPLMQILLITVVNIALAFLIAHLLRFFIGRYIKKYKGVSQRATTVAGLFRSIISYVVAFAAAIVILQDAFGVNTATLLTGAGILSIAVGLGAQTLIKDIIAGIFFLLEEQFSVGDLVTIEGFTGTVWELGLRSTTLSNATGDRFTIPNGSISKVTNHSRLTRGVAVRCDVSYETDLPRALAVLDAIGEAAFAAENTLLLEKPTVQGVTKLGEAGITLQMFCKCAPGNQFQLERDMLAQVKFGFDEAEIKLPYNRLFISSQST